MSPPELPIVGITVGLSITAMVIVGYVVAGFAHDVHRRRRALQRDRMQVDLAAVLFRSEAEAAAAADRLARAPRSTVFDLVQRLAADLVGDADSRLRNLVGSAGLTRAVRARLRSPSWRRRAQGAALASLLPAEDPDRLALLSDKNSTVRARATESLEREDVCAHPDMVTGLLDDPSEAVRFAAQQALLKGDARIVLALEDYLNASEGIGAAFALEVAANFPDPRLIPAIERHAKSTESSRRAIAARALGPWLSDASVLADLLSDDAPEVRATAATTIGAVGAETLAAQVGRLLRDEAWLVRRAAGMALSAMGPAGHMTLRVHLGDDDPYARDMAHQMVAIIEARFGTMPGTSPRSPVPAGAHA